jgi:protease-4
MLTKGVKPIIASMGDVAASGGYYIAMACDTIIAQPNTITGSIGIFGMLFNLENFLEDKLGITNDVVNTGTYSNIYNITRSLTPMERQIIQNSVNKGYETFTTKAAEGRNMEVADLKSVASGRVWTGKQAKERGLVDVLGSFDDAVSLAANAANLESDYMLVYYPAMENILDQFIKKGQESLDVYSSKNAGIMAPYIKELKSIENMRGLQARVPFQVKIN